MQSNELSTNISHTSYATRGQADGCATRLDIAFSKTET